MSEFQFRSGAVEQNAVSAVFPCDTTTRSEKNQRPQIVMVGMHLTKTRGGISTMVAGLLDSELKNLYDLRYIASQAEDFGKIRKLLLGVKAAVHFSLFCFLKRPQLAYVHVGSNASLYRESAFVLLAKLFRIKVITHFHAGDIENYYPMQPRSGQMFIRFALSMSDRLIAVSQGSARQLRVLLPAKIISVIPNAIDTTVFSQTHGPSKNHDGDEVKLLFVGAVGKLKGEKDLIQALAVVKDQLPNLRVSLLGYGAEDLAQLCADLGVTDLIDHLGPVSMSERIAYFERADIFVLPTYAEAMPISVIEAMAAGLAVITTPVGGIPELIEDGREGLLFPCGNVSTLAKKIAMLANNKTERLAIGARARQKVQEQMGFEEYVGKLERELRQVCG